MPGLPGARDSHARGTDQFLVMRRWMVWPLVRPRNRASILARGQVSPRDELDQDVMGLEPAGHLEAVSFGEAASDPSGRPPKSPTCVPRPRGPTVARHGPLDAEPERMQREDGTVNRLLHSLRDRDDLHPPANRLHRPGSSPDSRSAARVSGAAPNVRSCSSRIRPGIRLSGSAVPSRPTA